MSIRNYIFNPVGIALVSACQAANPPLETVDHVDLERFMGDWYVIANIPTFVEKGLTTPWSHTAWTTTGRSPRRSPFAKTASTAKRRRYTPRGFVRDTETNAEWGMQFVWPIKGDYRIIYLSEDYSTTIIGRNKRDYVWVMARDHEMPDSEYQQPCSSLQMPAMTSLEAAARTAAVVIVMKIAIIGTGIAGNVAAYKLAKDHDITVYEADNRIGGHTNTVDVVWQGESGQSIPGSSCSMMRPTPILSHLLDELGVESQPAT